ncbi:hypothetical protein Salat_1650600 [Sesamum alatum]|uniref:Reverse transcriptase zinc-binding domain-containing protein n=1 Tax=Sesamum alatum TaxID=300844 RepID=A0AAE1Y6E8_9LAMI|nr:hypothetical protein Salat_1650600 [Sesamum alatum]
MEGADLLLDSSLTLTDVEEAGVTLPPCVWPSRWLGISLTLVGRLLSHRSVNFEALRNSLSSLLRPVRGMSVQRVDDVRFCLEFNHVVDLNRTLSLCPWIFDRNLLILQPWTVEPSPTEVDLGWSPFFVHVHRLPYTLRTIEVVGFIGRTIGAWADADQMAAIFNGHICRFCPRLFEQGFVDPGMDSPYGPWLRENRPFRNLSPTVSPIQPTVLRVFRSSSSASAGGRSILRGAQVFGNFEKPNLAGQISRQPSQEICGPQEAACLTSPSLGPSAVVGPDSQPTKDICIGPSRRPTRVADLSPVSVPGPFDTGASSSSQVGSGPSSLPLSLATPTSTATAVPSPHPVTAQVPPIGESSALVEVPLVDSSLLPPLIGGTALPTEGPSSRFVAIPGAKRKLPRSILSDAPVPPGKKCLAFWARQEECLRVITEAWQPAAPGVSQQNTCDNLRRCQVGLQRWSSRVYKGVKGRIRSLEFELETLGSASKSADTKARESSIRAELNQFGRFTVKSAYHLLMNITRREEGHLMGESSSHDGNGWDHVWQNKLPWKIRIFLWRFASDGLPTVQNLLKRRLSVHGGCPICGAVDEDLCHVGLAAVVLWSIWYHRNKALMDGVRCCPLEVLVSAQNFLTSVEASLVVGVASQPVGGCSHWVPPPLGQLKINFDGSWSPGSASGGVGVVVRSVGVLLGVHSRPVVFVELSRWRQ